MVSNDSLVNENCEGYHITSELGSNPASLTFLGERISPTAPYQHVVIKLLYSSPIRDQQRQQDILQKISVLQKLHHPYILPIIAAGIHKDMPYIMTEYLPAGSLYNRLQGRSAGQPVYQEEAFLILAQVGQALLYAHQQQVIHGYLKLENVLFNIRNEALVTDFQRPSLLLPAEAEDTNTPELSLYQAPEQLMGQTNEKSDQYALGCLAYTLFTGHQAFMIPSIHTPGTYYKTRSLISPGRLNAALPVHIEEAILKAMSRDPNQRYADIAAFLAALKLPPAAGNRELRETIVTFEQIMQEEGPDQPATPSPEAGALEAAEKPPPADMLAKGGPLTFPIFGSTPTDMAAKGGPLTFPIFGSTPTDIVKQGWSPLSSSPELDEANQVTLKMLQPYGVSSRSSFNNRVRKSFTSRPRRTFAMIACVIAIIIVFVTMLIDLNFSTPTKKIAINGTPTVSSSAQTSTLAPIVIRSGLLSPTSGVTVPTQKVTPQSTVPHSTPTQGPTVAPTTVPTHAPTLLQVALAAFFNNRGMGDAPGQANFDGSGYSYPASQLPSGGQINLQGVPYQFPANGSGDNIVAFGQTIPLTPGHYQRAFLLAAASWGPVSGTMVVKYMDGSTATSNVTIPDWYASPGVLNTTYRYDPGGIDNHPVHIYAIPIVLDSTRIANALILPFQQVGPYQNGHIHVFALTLLP